MKTFTFQNKIYTVPDDTEVVVIEHKKEDLSVPVKPVKVIKIKD